MTTDDQPPAELLDWHDEYDCPICIRRSYLDDDDGSDPTDSEICGNMTFDLYAQFLSVDALKDLGLTYPPFIAARAELLAALEVIA